MKLKYTAALMVAVCGLSFMPMQSSFAAGAMPQAEEQTVEQKDTSKKTPPLEVTTTAINYKLINDSSGTLSKDDINQISNDLNDIFDKMKDQEKQFRFYTFIYDNPSKPVTEMSQEVKDKANLDTKTTPILFIFNKATNKFHFVIDERISGYVSKAYFQSLVQDTMIKKGVSEDSVDEMTVRASAMTAMAIKEKVTGAGTLKSSHVTVDEDAFETYSFNKDVPTEKADSDKQADAQKDKQKQEDNSMTYAVGALLLVLASLGVVFYKKKKANR